MLVHGSVHTPNASGDNRTNPIGTPPDCRICKNRKGITHNYHEVVRKY